MFYTSIWCFDSPPNKFLCVLDITRIFYLYYKFSTETKIEKKNKKTKKKWTDYIAKCIGDSPFFLLFLSDGGDWVTADRDVRQWVGERESERVTERWGWEGEWVGAGVGVGDGDAERVREGEGEWEWVGDWERGFRGPVRLRGSVGEWVGVGDGDAERVREGEGEWEKERESGSETERGFDWWGRVRLESVKFKKRLLEIECLRLDFHFGNRVLDSRFPCVVHVEIEF